MLFGRRKLYERDPKTLDIESLAILYGALLAKLLLVSRELGGRYEKLVDLSGPIANTDEARAVLAAGAKKLRGLSLILEDVLAQELGKVPLAEPIVRSLKPES